MTLESVVLAPLAILVAGIVAELLLARALSPRAKGWLACATGLAALVGVVSVWPSIASGRVVDLSLGPWNGPIGLAYHVDGLAFLFALMATGIGAAVLLYSVDYMAEERSTTRFYALVLAFIGGLVHLVYAADLFQLYLGWELVGLCSFLLVGFWYQREEAARGARKVLTMTHLAGYGLLAAVVLLHVRTGSTLWTDPRVQGAFTTGLFALVVVAALAKSVQFPLHTWIPDAMAAPTPVSALLHAACYVKAGVYLIARLHSIRPWPLEWGLALSWIGAVTLLVGALFMLAQRDLKRLLAFSTVSQIGYMMLGLGLGTPLGIGAALLHCLNHGLFKGGLFLCAGAVQHASGTRDMDSLGGLARRMPYTLRIWLVCAGGIAGVPLLNGFVSKWLLYTAALQAGQPLLALIPWIGSIFTVFAFLKSTSTVFLGEDGSASRNAHEVSSGMIAGGSILAAGCVLLGVAPQAAISALINPLLPALGCQPLNGVTWFGLSVSQGAWFATGGLALALVALLFGALVYWMPLRVGVAAAAGAPSVFTGGEPLSVQGRLGASDFSEIAKSSLMPFYRDFDVDRWWLALWRAMDRVATTLNQWSAEAERAPIRSLIAMTFVLGLLTGFTPLRASIGAASDQAAGALRGTGPLIIGTGMALAGLLLAAASAPATRRWLPWLASAGALAIVASLLEGTVARTLLLEASVVVALLTVWQASTRAEARWGYLVAVLVSSAGMLGGAWFAEHGHGQAALICLVPGLAMKLGLAPAWFWLPLLAESTPVVVAGLVIGVVDVAAFGEVLALRASYPGLFFLQPAWLAVGSLSAVTGAALALGQRDMRRLLAFSSLADLGLLTVALSIGGRYGVAGAALGAAVHALGKSLLFVSVSAPEAAGERLCGARGLAGRHPVAAAGFIVGALSILGVPPTYGYAAHWRLFAALASRPGLLAVCSLAAMLSVAVYARAFAVFWWGPSDGEVRVEEVRGNAGFLVLAIVLLATVLLAAGIWPNLLGGNL